MIRTAQKKLFAVAVGLTLAACGGGAEEVQPVSPAPGPPSAPPSAPPLAGGASFAQRCAQPGVIKCVGFDSDSDFSKGSGGRNGAYGFNSGIMPPSGTADYARATMDTTTRTSGNGSLKFTIPSNSGADTSGTYFTNFSDDLSLQFGENAEFFIQWRQRFSPEYIATQYAGGGGWKQVIVGTGDKAGTTYSSCTSLTIVLTNYYQKGFPIAYNSCTGSTSHGPYDGFYQQVSGDFKLQNARTAPNCLYTQKNTSFFPPVGNCFGYAPNEWMTFQLRVKTGPRIGDEFKNSYVTLWAAREGQASEVLIDWGPYNLSAGSPSENQRFGKVWLLPYNTGKSAAESHPTAFTWYDELVISRTQISDP